MSECELVEEFGESFDLRLRAPIAVDADRSATDRINEASVGHAGVGGAVQPVSFFVRLARSALLKKGYRIESLFVAHSTLRLSVPFAAALGAALPSTLA